VARNQFFCSRCGKALDLSQVYRQLASGEGGGSAATLSTGRREQGGSRYKSARKARR
jgi:hypothetical protein